MESHSAIVTGPPRGRDKEPPERPSPPPRGAEAREELMEAMLEACGEQGYRALALERACHRRAGARLGDFFDDAGDCFAAAYDARAEMLCERLLSRAREAGGASGSIEAAVRELADFIEERPALARSLLAEVHVAGPRALAGRAHILARLADALDHAYRDTTSAASPPAGTAAFLLATIEATALRACVERDAAGLAAIAPELAAMVEAAYSRIDPPRP
jgi:hypothetical protein